MLLYNYIRKLKGENLNKDKLNLKKQSNKDITELTKENTSMKQEIDNLSKENILLKDQSAKDML